MTKTGGGRYSISRALVLLAAALSVLATVSIWDMAAADEAGAAKRLALVIANAAYPDAPSPNKATLGDAKRLADELTARHFSVTLKQNLGKNDLRDAIDTLIQKITPDSSVTFYFNGYGIQAGRQTFLIPIDAQIWSEADVKRDGTSIDSVIGEFSRKGARIKIVILDASRRNPFERRFRATPAGLAPIDAPESTLTMFAAAPGKLVEDGTADVSLFMSELTRAIHASKESAEQTFGQARVAISQASKGEQVPWVASSLVEAFAFETSGEETAAKPAAKTADAVPKQAEAAPKPAEPAPKPATPPAKAAETAQTPAPPAAKLVETASKPVETAKPPTPAAKPTETAAKPADPAPKPAETPVKPEVPAAKPTEAASKPAEPAPKQEPKAPTPATDKPAEVAKTTPGPTAPAAPPASVKAKDTFSDCAGCPDMIVIPAGTFTMGSPTSPFQSPIRAVAIEKPLALGRTAVTFDDWAVCVADHGCSYTPKDQSWGTGKRPVVNISWLDAKAYITWLGTKSGHTYRLPTEAEWEYAARAGTSTLFYWGSAVGSRNANCRDCDTTPTKRTLPVATFAPNAFGLYDMGGNVAQWVEDCWNNDYKDAPRDGAPRLTGDCSRHVLRGGSFSNASSDVSPSARFRYDTDVRLFANGFRVARDLP